MSVFKHLFATSIRFLVVLQLSDMGLQSLPAAVIEMESLQTLNLDGNNLRTLPPTFTRLAYLREVSLQGNPMVALPPEIGTLPSLTELHYDRTVLRNPPAEILDRGLEVIVTFLKRLYDSR
jgi:internalin A